MSSNRVKAYLLIGSGLVWLGAIVLFVLFYKPFEIDLGQGHPLLSLLLAVVVPGFLLIGWLIPLCAGILRLWNRQILRPERPVSLTQRRLNRSAPLVLAIAGALFGLWQANQCAKIAFGYAATYSFTAAFALAILVVVLGLPPLIYWRTRWVGIGLLAAGLLSWVAFYGGIAALTKLDRVAWRHESPEVRFGPDQKATAVIYFCRQTSNEQIENFSEFVLEELAEPRHPGRDFPVFVDTYIRLSPTQANGYDAIALTFRNEGTSDRVRAYMRKIESDPRVKNVFKDVVPTEIRMDKTSADGKCR